MVGSEGKEFTAIASLQDSVPPNGCFAMFSYPVREAAGQELRFNFTGYVNNVTHGYADGINPIAALKYGRATVTKSPDHAQPYESPRLSGFVERLGPTYESRNQITSRPTPISDTERLDWEMRELIVTRGLPRAKIKREFDFSDVVAMHGTEPRFWNIPDDEFQIFLDFSKSSSLSSYLLIKTSTFLNTSSFANLIS